jgi:mRNA interferase HigB
MKVHLVRKETIEKYVVANVQSRTGFTLFLTACKFADWNEPGDIQATFPTADLLGNGSDRVVFDIGGQKYRVICKYYFGEKEAHLFVYWIGTHAAYSRLCRARKKEPNQYTVKNY